jgi:hypothetical protein
MSEPIAPATRDYFDHDEWRLLAEQAAADPRCPRWLVDAFGPLGRLAPRLPAAAAVVDEARFNMIYPH